MNDPALLEAAKELALRTARTIRQPVEHIVRRPRTQRWFLKALRRSLPDAGDEDLRAVIGELENVYPPPEVTEACTDPVWRRRARRLTRRFPRLKLHALIERARREFGWHHELTLSVLIVAEEEGRVILDGEHWRRRRPEDDPDWQEEPGSMRIVSQAGTRRKLPPMRIVPVERKLPCPLRPAEVVQAVERTSEILAEIDFTREELTAFVKSRREKIRASEKALKELSRLVREKTEERAVRCEERHVYERKVVLVVRLDTGATVEERPMTPDELQLTIPTTAPVASSSSSGARV